METEITAKIFCTRNEASKILERNGFFFKEKFLLVDSYYTHLKLEPDIEYQKLLESSIVIRDADFNRRYGSVTSSTLMYKDKLYDERGEVVSETKKTCDISSSVAANEIFALAGFTEWCTKSVNGYVFKKGNNELLIQEVDDLGLFLEIEEFPSQRDQPESKKMKELIEFAKSLGLPLGHNFNEKISYLLFKKGMASIKTKQTETVTVSFDIKRK